MRFAAVLVVAVVAAAAGYGVYQWRLAPEARATTTGEALWSRPLPDLAGAPQTLAQWRGRVLVVNFWATWCAPCREEIPVFVELQRRYGERGLQFVGIAIDQPDKVAPFAAEFGINYPVLVGGLDAAEWSRDLGNRVGALPFTLVIDRDGDVRMTHLGELKEAALLRHIQPLL
jgi:thiol-disulfide isomerase/thioredoxin